MGHHARGYGRRLSDFGGAWRCSIGRDSGRSGIRAKSRLPEPSSASPHARSPGSAEESNRALLRAGAPVLEVWIPQPGNRFLLDLFRLDAPAGPPSFEAILFDRGTPVRHFQGASLAALRQQLLDEYPAFKRARIVARSRAPVRLPKPL